MNKTQDNYRSVEKELTKSLYRENHFRAREIFLARGYQIVMMFVLFFASYIAFFASYIALHYVHNHISEIEWKIPL